MKDLLISFRKELHQYPELSGKEESTAKRVKRFISEICPPDEWIERVGGHGLIAIYSLSDDGPTVMIRCELDALPISESNDFPYQSKNIGVSHKCGHDGHMSIVAGLAFSLKHKEINRGTIALLFQPAEENGTGARAVCGDERFIKLNPDFIFALHNIPGRELHSVSIVPGYFSATVQSFSLHLKGKECHAAEPENGVNPAYVLSKLIDLYSELNCSDPLSDNYSVLTPVYVHLGSKDYGISPGKAEVHYTIRTWSVNKMKVLRDEIEKIAHKLISKENISFEFDWFEYFPSAKNDLELNAKIEKVAHTADLKINEEAHPFKFGEDFGWYSENRKVAMFGIGSGMSSPALHHADYDFPDELLFTGITMFEGIIKECLK